MRSIEFLYDYASPWSFLADQIVERKLPSTTIVRRPVYLRGFEAFSTGIPYSSAKLVYIVKDFERCAAHEGVTIRMPTRFPLNGLHALRAAIAAQEAGTFPAFHAAMFRAAWQEDRDISDREVVREIAAQHGVSEFETKAVKDKLRADTEAAVARGVFGVPTFFVGDEMFWGHDRLDFVARALQSQA